MARREFACAAAMIMSPNDAKSGILRHLGPSYVFFICFFNTNRIKLIFFRFCIYFDSLTRDWVGSDDENKPEVSFCAN